MLTRRTEWADWPSFGFGDYSPFYALEQLRREVDRVFSEVERGPLRARSGMPVMTLEDAGDHFSLRAELPGLTEKDIEISVTAESLTVRGERKAEVPQGYTVHRQERGDFKFARTFALPVRIEPDKVEATLKNGVLTLSLPKAPEARPKQIPVKAS